MDARARLEHVGVTSFAIDPRLLAVLLPAGVEPRTIAVGDGRAVALVSAVSFSARSLRVSGLPFVGFDGGHVDYRAYVRARGEDAVWFLGAAMDSRVAWILRGLWGMPWHRATVSVDGSADAYRFEVRNRRFSARVIAKDLQPGVTPPGFASVDDAARMLVNPTVGLYQRGRGMRRYEVEHSPPPPVAGTPVEAEVELFQRLGLVRPGDEPHSVLVVPDFDIAIRLPPRRVS